jgi:hypothetical protein
MIISQPYVKNVKMLGMCLILNIDLYFSLKFLRSYIPCITRGCVTPWPCHLHLKNIVRQKNNFIFFGLENDIIAMAG